MKLLNIITENKSKDIICYHRSNDLKHMINGDLDVNKVGDNSLFGRAIYFSSSPDISSQFGKYVCKFQISIDEPCLNMNAKITIKAAKELLVKFNIMFNTKILINTAFVKQIGDFFDVINDDTDWEYTKHYKKFIESLGYNSFRYYSNYHTDFMNSKGDYGTCYGLYNNQNIKFLDGPF